MFDILFTEQFEKSFSALRNTVVKKQIWNKILQLESKAPLGKKLMGNPFWSIHVNKYRIIYQMKGKDIIIIDILQRKHGYREI